MSGVILRIHKSTGAGIMTAVGLQRWLRLGR